MSEVPTLAVGMVPTWFLVLVFGTMVAVLAVVLAVIGRLCLPKVPSATIYALSPVVSAALIYGFLWARSMISSASEERSQARYAKEQAQAAELIELKAWWPVPNAEDPRAVHLEVETRASGWVAVGVEMAAWPSEPGESPAQTFLLEDSDATKPQPAKAGATFGLDVPLRRLSEGAPQAIAITLRFTDLPAGATALGQVTKCYANFARDGLRLVQVQAPLPPAADPKAWGR